MYRAQVIAEYAFNNRWIANSNDNTNTSKKQNRKQDNKSSYNELESTSNNNNNNNSDKQDPLWYTIECNPDNSELSEQERSYEDGVEREMIGKLKNRLKCFCTVNI